MSVLASVTPISSLRIIYVRTPRSRSPVLVPIISPSTGVSPIDVSTDLPFLIAATDAPLPKWHEIIFELIHFPPIISHALVDT